MLIRMKRWVFGTLDEQWHMVGSDDRDYGYGLTDEEFHALGEPAARKRYLENTVFFTVTFTVRP